MYNSTLKTVVNFETIISTNYSGRIYSRLSCEIFDSEIYIKDVKDDKFYKELLRKYGLAKLRKNKVEMSNLEQQLKVCRKSSL